MNTRWEFNEAKKIFSLPFNDLLYKAHTVHRENFNPNTVQFCTLLNVKTGGCPENCSYCPQSAHYRTYVQKEAMMEIDDIVEAAKKARDAGASRFCMGAALRGPDDRSLNFFCDMIARVKELGLETCATLGLLKDGQAEKMKEAGLDFYNHNIDTSEEFYDKIITTRKFSDRMDTLKRVRDAGMKVCCGGIIGMGESNDDRISMLLSLANLDTPPESLPINKLIPIPGTPLGSQKSVDHLDFVRIIALGRIMMPKSYVRLSAGREGMSDEMQALCFFAGANSIFYGEKLLTADNPIPEKDNDLFMRLGING